MNMEPRIYRFRTLGARSHTDPEFTISVRIFIKQVCILTFTR